MASAGMVVLEGSIEAGPPSTTSTSFPKGTTSIPLALNPSNGLAAPRQTGDMVIELSSAGAFATLDGVGTGKTVTKATFLYVAVATPMQLRLTCKDPGGGSDLVSTIPVNGPAILQFDVAGYLKLVEVKGAGTVNWYASGSE